MARPPSHLKKTVRGLIAGALLCALPISAHAQDISSGLAGHWKLDETTGATITDSIGGNDGTWADGSGNDVAEETTAGPVGTALSFDGTDDGITISNDYDPSIFTACTWFNIDGAAADKDHLIDIYEDNNNGMSLRYDSGTGEIFIRDDTAGSDSDTYETAVTQNEWHHACFGIDAAADMFLYIDGTSVGSGTSVDNLLSTLDTSFFIGRRGNGAETFQGKLDDVRLYSRELSAEDIALLASGAVEGAIRYNETSEAIEYHSGTSWVHAGLGSYSPNTVTFNGTSDYLTHGSALTGVSDSKVWTGSLWFRRSADNGSNNHFYDTDGTGGAIYIDTGDTFTIKANNIGGSIILDVDAATNITDTNWHHIMWSFDLKDPGKRHLYLDGVDDLSVNTYTDDTMFHSDSGGYWVGAADDNSEKFVGDIADLWMNFSTYVDLSDAANRAKFISANDMPMYLGTDGSLPLGFAPDIFLSGDTDSWHLNKGTGGDFTENGALTDAASQPAETSSDMTWAQEGVTLSGPIGNPGITTLNTNTIVFIDETNQDLMTVEWNGTNWSPVGNAFNIPGILNPTLSTIGPNTIAVADDGNDDLTTYKWDGANWEKVGSSYSLAGIGGDLSITTLDTNLVAFIGQNVFDLTTLIWDGSVWSQVGNELNITNAFNPSITTIDENTIAFYATSSVSAVRTYKWDGSDWSQVGNDLSGSMDKVDITAIGTNRIALWGESHEELRTYKWDGSDWSQVGAGLSLTIPFSSYVRLTALDHNTIAFIDNPNDDLETYTFEDQTPCATPTTQPGSIIYNTDDKVMQYCNGTEYVAMGPIGGTGGGGCADPIGAAGDMIFNTDESVMQYCNAEDWVAIGNGLNTVPIRGLAGHWKLDEQSGDTIADSAGSNTGTWTDGADEDVTDETTSGQINTALVFDGVNDFISIPDDPTLNPSDDYTLAAWFFINNENASYGAHKIISKDLNGTNSAYEMDMNEPEKSLRCSFSPTSGGVQTAESSDDTVEYGAWYHGACVYNSTTNTLKAYLNGVLEDTDDTTGFTPDTVSEPVRIGRQRHAGSEEYMDGSIDDVRIYTEALTDSEIAALYAKTSPSALTVPTADLVAHYKLNEETGSTIVDSSGNGFNGTWYDNVNDNVAEEFVAAKDSTGISFDGVSGGGGDDYIDLGTTNILTGREAAFSICTWVKLDTLTSAEYIIYGRYGGGVSGAFLFQADSNSKWGIETGTGGFNNMYANTRLTPGAWTHLCAVRNGGTLYFYKNGAADGSTAYTQPNSIVGADQFITAGQVSLALDGTLDDLRIYTRTLTPTEVNNLYLATGGGS